MVGLDLVEELPVGVDKRMTVSYYVINGQLWYYSPPLCACT